MKHVSGSFYKESAQRLAELNTLFTSTLIERGHMKLSNRELFNVRFTWACENAIKAFKQAAKAMAQLGRPTPNFPSGGQIIKNIQDEFIIPERVNRGDLSI